MIAKANPRSLPQSLLLVAWLAIAIGFLGATTASAQPRDATNARDPLGFKRIKGSTIVWQEVKAFDQARLPFGPPTGPSRDQYQFATIEGRFIRTLYRLPKDVTMLEVVRSYEDELRGRGYEFLFRCSNDNAGECGTDLLGAVFPTRLRNAVSNPIVGSGFGMGRVQRYFLARLARPEGDVHVSLYVSTDDTRGVDGDGLAWVNTVEAKPLVTRMVADPKADEMARRIDRDGRVALYGILFDFDKTDIKPESAVTLAEIGQLLQKDTKLKLYVVGHTDAQGQLGYNRTLSEKRAEAVVRYLAGQFKIAPERLVPAGVGPLAPVATNATDEGRAKNRRVELVARPQ